MVNKNFAVGLFVVAALAAFVGGTVWLTGKQGSEPSVGYSIFFAKDVGGLMLGGPVFYLGVEVGTLTAMKIIPGSTARVRVDIEVLNSVPIDSGTYASIAFQGITGVAVIKLAAEPGTHAPLEKGGDSPFPVIEARDTGLSALLDNAPLIAERLDAVLVGINKFLSEENQVYINSILGDFAALSHALAEEKDSIHELPVLLKQALKALNETLAQINAMAEKLDPGLDSTVANLEQATASLAKMSARMEAWTAANDDEMNAFMGAGLGQLPGLIEDAHTTLREAKKLLKELRDDPSRLMYQRKEDHVELEH
jgi:phospholipid/cholesterol/gamma-HCH transport system substrate-binding protein